MAPYPTNLDQGLYRNSGADLQPRYRPYHQAPAVQVTFDNNYFNDRYQGIHRRYNLTEALLDNVEVRTDINYFDDRALEQPGQEGLPARLMSFSTANWEREYRSLHFETEVLDRANFKGNAIINYTDKDVPFTRISSTNISNSAHKTRP